MYNLSESIPKELILETRLKFPRGGKRLFVGALLFIYANFSMNLVNSYKLGQKEELALGDIIMSSLGYLVQTTIMGTIHFLCVLFMTAWIHNFSMKIKKVEEESFLDKHKIESFLVDFTSLKKGLGE